MPGPLKRGTTQVAEQNDVTKLYEVFEEAFVDVLTANEVAPGAESLTRP